MKKLFSLFAAVLFAGSMMADSYTIEFKDSGSASDSNTGLTSTTISDYVATGADYISAIAATGKVYNAQQGWGLKFGNSSNPGTVTLTLATPVKPTSIVISASQYGATEGSALLQDSVIDLTAGGGKGEFNDYTYEYDGNTEVTTIIIGTSAKRAYVKSVTVNYEAGPAPKVATPVISGDAEFTDSVIVTITCTTPEADIYYTTDGTTDPKCDCSAAPEYEHALVIKETTTIKAAAYTGNDWSAVAEKTFTKKEKAQPITCAEVYSKAKGDELALNNVVVTYANGKNVYVQDATGSMLLYLAGNTTWEAGNILSGVEGKLDIYNGLYEVKMTDAQAAAVQPGQGEAPAPVEFTAAPVAADMNKYIVLKNVTVSAETFPSNKNMNCTIGDGTFVLRNNFNADVAFDTLKTYDITGVVAVYNATVQVYFINAEEVKDEPVQDWTEIIFPEAVSKDNLPADAVFEYEGLKVAITDSENKMEIDGNIARFGNADEIVQYDFRLKTGGKSQSGTKNNFITITVPADGDLRLAVRTGSNSDETRTLVLVQNGDTICNQIVKEADAAEVIIDDSTTVKVYPYITVPVKAGEIKVGYPVNGINFYSFAFKLYVPTYTIAGAPATLFGTTWDPSNKANDMEPIVGSDYLYGWQKNDVALAAGNIEFKVCLDHAWAHAWPSKNYVLPITEDGLYNVSIFFNPEAEADSLQVLAIATKTADIVVLPRIVLHGNFTGSWADTKAFEAAEDSLTATLKLALKEGSYEFGFKFDDNWKANGANLTREANSTNLAEGSGNMHIAADIPGDYIFTYTYATQEVVVTYPEPIEEITCAAVYALDKDAKVALNEVVVTYVNGKNVWVKDETASMLIYLSTNSTWKAGDVLKGVAGVVDIYNDLYEVKPSAEQVAAVVVTEGEAPAPEEPETITADNMNAYVLLKGIELEGAFTGGTNESLTLWEGLVLFNKFKLTYTFEAGKKYDILGVVGIFKGALQVNFISAEESVEPEVVRLDVDYVEALHMSAYNAWQLNFFKDWTAEEGVTYPDFYVVLAEKSPTALAGTYEIEKEEILFVQLFTSENDSAMAIQATNFYIEFLGEGLYQFTFAFLGTDNINYALDVTLEPSAYEYGTWEEIELTDGSQDVEITNVTTKAVKTLNNGIVVIEKNGVKYNVLGQIVR